MTDPSAEAAELAKLQAVLERRAERLARRQGGAADRLVAGRVAVVEVGAERFGIPVEALREIVSCPPVAALPALPSFMRGIVQIRGELMSVVDLGRWMAVESSGEQAAARLAVIETPGGALGLLADRVIGFREIAEDELADASRSGEGGRGSVRAITRDLLAILDLDRLAKDPRLVVGRRAEASTPAAGNA